MNNSVTPTDKTIEATEKTNETGLIDPIEPQDADKLNDIRNSRPGQEVHLGKETVGQGAPVAQSTNQHGSLPATAVPVEKNFTKTGEFYNPNKV